MTHQKTVSDADEGIRLDRWFKRHLPGLQHALLERHLRKGAIRLDGKKSKTSERVSAGQIITYPDMTLDEKPRKKYQLSDEDSAMMKQLVIYKDDHVIVLNKPFGLPVQGGSKVSKSVDDMLDALMFDQPFRPKLVHRLDRDTSGVLVLARTAKVAAILSKAFASKDMDKTYWALTHNVPLEWNGTIDYKLLKAVQGESSYERVAVDDEEGKYARTEYRVLDALARRFSFMELKPHTGRTHQLRVHMAAIECPIVGDHKYGGGMSDAKNLGVEDALHLHARRIIIPAQGGMKALDVTAPMPPHMLKTFKVLGIDVPKK